MLPLVINLFGVPGAGKSTGATYIFSKLKMNNLNAELITEYAKDKCYEGATQIMENQFYISAKQYHKFFRIKNSVDIIVTDSPLLLGSLYNKQHVIRDDLNNILIKLFFADDHINMNYFIKRVKPFNTSGRFHNENESDLLVKPLQNMLSIYNVEFVEINGDENGYDIIVDDVINKFRHLKQS